MGLLGGGYRGSHGPLQFSRGITPMPDGTARVNSEGGSGSRTLTPAPAPGHETPPRGAGLGGGAVPALQADWLAGARLRGRI